MFPAVAIVFPENGATILGDVLVQIEANDREDALGSLSVIAAVLSSGGLRKARVRYNAVSGFY